ncbi:MAG: hypothetical protein WCP15_01905 [bacterium]
MKDFEQKIEKERNVEKDRSQFLEAVSATVIEEIDTEFDEISLQKLKESIESNTLFILGEVHGVKENVNIIYTLFKKFGFRQLALEWKPALKDVIDKFIETGEIDFNVINKASDGRITAGHFALIKKMKTEGILENIICFTGDPGQRDWNKDDEIMANNILSSLSSSPMLAVAGRLHTKTETITSDDDTDEKHPMAQNVKKKIPNVSTGEIKYLGGHYHNIGTKEFDAVHESAEPRKAKFFQNGDGLYIFELPFAHEAVVPNPGDILV